MKKHAFLVLILILFFSLGAVCATDDVLSESNGGDLEIAEWTIADDGLSDGNGGDLEIADDDSQNAIDDDLSESSLLEKTQENILSEGGESSFSQLQNDINSSTEILEITHDYKFYNETDVSSRIILEKNDFIINGNNHIIDANNLSPIFDITGTNILINNLIIKNAKHNSGSALFINRDSTVTTNNVTFANCTART